jgi:hypothetical protein
MQDVDQGDRGKERDYEKESAKNLIYIVKMVSEACNSQELPKKDIVDIEGHLAVQ